nr:hypothetical protein [Tanacetum cinerariifolium]
MDEDMGPDEQAQSSDDGDIGSAHILKVNLRKDWWNPFKEERPATPEPAWLIPSFDVPISMNNWASALASNYSPPPEDSLLAQTGLAFEIVKVFHPDVIQLQYQMEECHKLLTDSVDDPIIRHNVSKPLPLGGPPGQVTIQSNFFFNKDLEYLRYGRKGSRHISFGLKRSANMILLQCMVSLTGDSKDNEGDRSTVRTHMRILSIVRIEVFSMYGYDYLKKIVLRHLNHLPPKDKKILTTAVNQWTRHLVIRQRVEDFQLRIKSYQTQLNLTKPQWDAMGFEYKHDYTVIDSPRADKHDESRFKYEFLDQEGRRSEQGVHVRHSEAIEDKEDLPQPGELCWWTRQRGRLQNSKVYRMIKSFRHSRSLSDDL